VLCMLFNDVSAHYPVWCSCCCCCCVCVFVCCFSGFPSVGKSTLLTKLTGTFSEVKMGGAGGTGEAGLSCVRRGGGEGVEKGSRAESRMPHCVGHGRGGRGQYWYG